MDRFSKSILQPILNSIAEFSDRNAFCIDEEFYSYKQFAENISKIRIAINSVKSKNDKVGLVVNDNIETYASIVALWLEGKSYVPLHPDWPIERCIDIIEQVDIDLILDSSSEQTRYNLLDNAN